MSDMTPLSTNEISHRINRLESRSDDHSDAINAMATRLAAGDEILKTLAETVNAVRKDIKWASRLVLTAVILAILALVLKEAAVSGSSIGPSSSQPRAP